MFRYLLLPIFLASSYNISQELCVVDSTNEKVCLQWECTEMHTIEACAAVYLTWTCGLLQHDSLMNYCCNYDRTCLSTLYEQSLNTLKFGRRIDDPLHELSKRRQRLLLQKKDKVIQTLEHVLEKLAERDKVLVIQVGAHVGALTNDPIYPYLATMSNMVGILFEPMPVQFQGLSYNYRHAILEERVQLVNAAVCKNVGDVIFFHKRPPTSEYSAHEEGAHTSFDPLFHFMYRDETSQMGTLGTSYGTSPHVANIQRDGIQNNNNNNNKYIQSIVTCTTLHPHVSQLLLQHPSSPLILIVDAEGADVVVLRDMLSIQLPHVILYEHTHINITDALNLMNQYGYICSYYQMVDTLCTQRSAEEMKKDNKMTLSTYPATVDTFVSHPTFVKNSAGMIIENQIVEYCSINRILEHECDTLLLLVQNISTTIEESGIRNEERQ
jgi:FkbM family methyltransferase